MVDNKVLDIRVQVRTVGNGRIIRMGARTLDPKAEGDPPYLGYENVATGSEFDVKQIIDKFTDQVVQSNPSLSLSEMQAFDGDLEPCEHYVVRRRETGRKIDLSPDKPLPLRAGGSNAARPKRKQSTVIDDDSDEAVSEYPDQLERDTSD